MPWEKMVRVVVWCMHPCCPRDTNVKWKLFLENCCIKVKLRSFPFNFLKCNNIRGPIFIWYHYMSMWQKECLHQSQDWSNKTSNKFKEKNYILKEFDWSYFLSISSRPIIKYCMAKLIAVVGCGWTFSHICWLRLFQILHNMIIILLFCADCKWDSWNQRLTLESLMHITYETL